MYQLKKLPVKTGEVFGKWTVLGLDPNRPNKRTYFLCRCICGKESSIQYRDLLNKTSTGCRGCHKKQGPHTCKKGHDTRLCGIGLHGNCKLCTLNSSMSRLYGLSLEEYTRLFNIQSGLCAICKKPLSVNSALPFGKETEHTRRAEIDHKHVPKKVKPQPSKRSLVRGLLCGGRYAGCNAKLGHVDNIEWLEAAAAYLKNPPAQKERNNASV